MSAIQAIRGMKDLLPGEIELWHKLEEELMFLMRQYGYQEIRMPLLEKTDLFKRSIGEVTDIVEKEMYTFDDRNGDSLTLRPEGTAQCVRSALQHGLLHNQNQKLWYYGPMYRYERPQKGRYRQFYQLGVEAFGLTDPEVDVEQIIMVDRLWKRLGLRDSIRLKINSLGTQACRQNYRQALVSYFEGCKDALDEDSLRRLTSNPLRILDSKNPKMAAVIEAAPKMVEYLSEDARMHFEKVQSLLQAAEIAFDLEPTLVRGLDYYTLTVYEWVTESLGAQGTVCGGGRYDDLVSMMGGKPTPAVGFAMGIERIIAMIEANEQTHPTYVDAYAVFAGDTAQAQSIVLAESIRALCPNLRLVTHMGGGSIKSQFKKADKSMAKVALVFGDDEMNSNSVTVKPLRTQGEQETVAFNELEQCLQRYL